VPIPFRCGGCGAAINAPSKLAGRQAKCPSCGDPVMVPAPVATPAPARPAPEPKPEYKACPLCSERILATAKKCKHCGEMLDPQLRAPVEPAAPSAVAAQPTAPAVSFDFDAPDDGQYRPTYRPTLPASGLGLASFVMGALVLLVTGTGIVITVINAADLGERDRLSRVEAEGRFERIRAGVGIASYGLCLAIILAPIGFCLGLGGLFQGHRSRVTCVLGLITNGIALAGLAFLFLASATLVRH
jgi:DNA-directed RNA polymerase subunit RPC12/RpoP